MAFLGLLRRSRYERAGVGLYNAAVVAARDPYLYRALGVPDTLDGRFDMIGLHVVLLIRRLQSLPAPGAALAQAVFDAMFGDMDHNLREMGVGDLAVGKRVRAMWEALHGRAQAYEAAMSNDDEAALAAVIARNVWRGSAVPAGSATALAAVARAQAAHLDGQDLGRLAAGRADFLRAEEAGG
ncbi:MAG: ubiquinol-cytochrome C chaperone family protein [Acetobacteraceae bacterium]|nr:ubiquinol-cytochrome C chaperone family protein [Acetobacteraceae bacterium]